MTAREPSAVEVIAEALAGHEMGGWLEVAPDRYRRRCTCGEFLDARDNAASFREHQTAVVIAAFADMEPLNQAELLCRGLEKFHDRNGSYWERVVGPWREVRP